MMFFKSAEKKVILHQKQPLLNIKPKQKRQVAELVEAVIKGDVATVKKYCSRKDVDVNALVQGQYNSRPALVALVNGDCHADEKTRLQMAQLLIDAGAKPETQNSNGNIAFHYSQCSPAIMAILITAKPSSVTTKDQNGATPLHHQTQWGNAEQCQLLINAKADMNATDNQGDTL